MTDAEALRTLAEIAAIPTGPFHEQGVATFVAHFLRATGLGFTVDQFGNLIAKRDGDLPGPPVALVAHLDHPAIEISQVVSDTQARASLLGGVPAACFDQPVPVVIYTASGCHKATIVGHNAEKTPTGPLSLDIISQGTVTVGDLGVFDLPSFQTEGTELALRAADDLAGVAAALVAFKRVVDGGVGRTVYGIFTRAEEVGLVGATLIAERQLLPTDTIVVSLECSRELPGAKLGEGPVIRVGDRTQAFHPEGEALLLAAREQIPTVSIQRQLMSGGSCEATAFGVAGYRTTGVALPLVNYHNIGPGNVIAPERISSNDFLSEIELLVAALKTPPDRQTRSSAIRLRERAAQYRGRLETSASDFQAL